MSSVTNTPSYNPNGDELNLAGLIFSLLQQKKIIALFVALFGLLGVIYVFFAPKEYQFRSVLRPAAINQLDALNRSNVYKLSPDDALGKVGVALNSHSNRLAYFEANQELFKDLIDSRYSVEQNFNLINKDFINLVIPDEKVAAQVGNYIDLGLSYPNGVDGAKILNGFVAFVVQQQRDQITADVDVIVKNRLAELKAKIDAVRSNYEADKVSRIATLEEGDRLRRALLQDELAALRLQLKTERKNRIAELGEAIAIAKSLGIKRPTTPSAMGDEVRGTSSGMVRNEVNNQDVPLYFLGSDALEAERTALLQRQTDDFNDRRVAEIVKELKMLEVNRQIQQLQLRKNEDEFLVGLEPLRAESVRLKNLNIDFDNLQIVSVDQQAMVTDRPAKPKKAFVIGLALLVGFIAGIIVALFRGMMQKQSELATAGLLPMAKTAYAPEKLPDAKRTLA